MKKAVMQKWVAALRSGYFKQGKQNLNNIDQGTHCCLGVLSDLAVAEGVCEYDAENSISVYGTYKHSSGLSREVLKWSGMKDSLGEFKSKQIDPLFRLNDRGELNFKEIADIIEKNYKDL